MGLVIKAVLWDTELKGGGGVSLLFFRVVF